VNSTLGDQAYSVPGQTSLPVPPESGCQTQKLSAQLPTEVELRAEKSTIIFVL